VTRPTPTRAVVFDCDGLLLETESRWTLAEQAVCAANDTAFDMELKHRLHGTSLADAGLLLAEWCDAPPSEGPRFGQELIEAYRTAIDEHGVEPMPGVPEILEALHGRVPLAVASNTAEPDTRRVLARSGLGDVFDAIRCAGDGIAAKPAPDVYLAACAAVGAEPATAAAFEDSPLGSRAAMAAGMRVIGIPSVPGSELDTPILLPSMAAVDVRALLDGDLFVPAR